MPAKYIKNIHTFNKVNESSYRPYADPYLDDLMTIANELDDQKYSDIESLVNSIKSELESSSQAIDDLEEKVESLKNELNEKTKALDQVTEEKDDLAFLVDQMEEEIEIYKDVESRFENESSTTEKEDSLKETIKMISAVFDNIISLSTVIGSLDKYEIEILKKYIKPEIIEAATGKGSRVLNRYLK